MIGNVEREITAAEKNFLMKTVKFLILDDKQISQARQIILRYFDNNTFNDEDYALIEEWTDSVVNA